MSYTLVREIKHLFFVYKLNNFLFSTFKEYLCKLVYSLFYQFICTRFESFPYLIPVHGGCYDISQNKGIVPLFEML